jgi:hypothetical protein
MRSSRLSLIVFSLLLSVPSFAATFIVPEDKVLIEGADAVVIGVVQSSEGVLTDNRGVQTITEVLVSEVLKGDAIVSGQIVWLREPGGRTDTISLELHGVPRYEAGDRVMLMLKRDSKAGLWRTHEYALGKFGFLKDEIGREFLVRDRENVCGWSPGFTPYRERARRLGEFLEYIRSVAHGEHGDADYFVEFDELCIPGGQSELNYETSELTANMASDYLSLCNCRWNNNGTASFESTGSQSGYTNSRSDASVGMSPWNNHGDSNINYTLGGTSGGSQAFNSSDGINSVIFEDPSNEVNGTGCFSGSGTLAIGGPWFSSSQHTFGGESFNTTLNVDLVVDCGVNPSNGISQTAFQSILAHELGHTLGFRHSNEPPCGGCDTASTALMASLINNGPGNASLMAWDQRAAAAAYGSGTTTCTEVSIASHPQSTSIPSGSSANLSVTASGTGPFTYQWYRGTSGTTTNPVGTNSASFNTGTLTATTSYWVRVTNCTDKTANSNAATVTVTDCTLPAVTSEPPDVSITSGSSTTLSVAASGTPTITYQWYRHIGGGNFQAVTAATTSKTYNTGTLTSSQAYLAVVRNPCATGDDIRSRVVTVTVTTSCTAPAITTQPASVTINPGQSTTLTVGATGTSLQYQWFEGDMGVTSKPVGTNAPSFTTPALSATTKYWVRVSNSCGNVPSQAATVAISAPCVKAAVTVQPASVTITMGQSATLTVGATGTNVQYQWYEGVSGDFSKPVGTNAPSFTTPVLTATTKYWVLVSSPCGGAGSQTATVTVVPKCPAGKLCSLGGRFELGLAARDHRTNKTGTGMPLQQNDLFGFFSLPELTGDPNNPEVFVKVLDGRTINGQFWTFYGGLTDLEYTLTVQDKVAGTSKTYFKTGGTSNGGFDVGSGVKAESCVGEVNGTPAGSENPSVCSAGSNRLCLSATRFRVELSARDQRTGNTAEGVSIPQGDIFGYFALPGLTSDPNNPEVFVKIIDGRVINSFHWIFFSGLTDFEYTLTVVDTFTGLRKTYTKAPGSACGFFDTNAF